MVTVQEAVEVEVFGQRFRLCSEKSEGEVQQIAAYVDHQLQQVAEHARTGLLRIALMAALTIADEYHTATGRLDVPPVE
jgi:cell division protein ZapA (FtsZ GTPase activity inhibitor)